VSVQAQQERVRGQERGAVEVKVDYLPATEDFRQEYLRQTAVETIRADAMRFFGVHDRTVGRDIYAYYLAHDGGRIQDTQLTLGQVIGEHALRANFALIEEITTGGAV
jgi:hypothetical protein